MGAITDPVGNGLAIIALVGMLIVLGGSLYRLRGGYSLPITAVWWQMPVVALAGDGVIRISSTKPASVKIAKGKPRTIKTFHENT